MFDFCRSQESKSKQYLKQNQERETGSVFSCLFCAARVKQHNVHLLPKALSGQQPAKCSKLNMLHMVRPCVLDKEAASIPLLPLNPCCFKCGRMILFNSSVGWLTYFRYGVVTHDALKHGIAVTQSVEQVKNPLVSWPGASSPYLHAYANKKNAKRTELS